MQSLSVDNYVGSSIINAPAKLNLTLRVDGKMPDDFHRIRSLICPISLTDKIHIEVFKSNHNIIEIICTADPEIKITAEDSLILNSKRNLACKAAESILSKLDQNFLIKIKIDKSIPTQAGLGGGSSDAAAVLLGLSQIFSDIKFDLVEIASSIGSDVVSLLFRELIFVYGRGDKFSKIKIHQNSNFNKFLSSLNIILLKPNLGINTAWAYSKLEKSYLDKSDENIEISEDKRFEMAGINILDQQTALSDNLLDITYSDFINDFEPIISELVTEVKKSYTILYDLGAKKVLLAGSGSTVFGLFENDSFEISKIVQSLKANLSADWFVKQCKFMV